MNQKSICFISFYAYPTLADSKDTITGGAEYQQIELAKYLVRKNYNISFIVGDFGQKKLESINDIKVYRVFNPKRRNHGFNFFRNMYSLFQTMKCVNADVYNFRSDSFYVGPIALFCKILRKRFVFSAGIDTNASLSILKTLKRPMGYLYKWGLKTSDAVTSQTEKQRETFLKNFAIDTVLIRNGIRLKLKVEEKHRKYFLWIGTIVARKHPELYLQIASQFPDEQFLMIGGPGRDGIYDKIKKKALKLRNVKFVGFVPQREIDKYIMEAKAFVSTSESEGFPNTFLQAWLHETPVISLHIDPDECICNYKSGFHSRNIKQMCKDIEELLHNEKLGVELGKNGRQYVLENHDISVIADQYIKVFERQPSF